MRKPLMSDLGREALGNSDSIQSDIDYFNDVAKDASVSPPKRYRASRLASEFENALRNEVVYKNLSEGLGIARFFREMSDESLITLMSEFRLEGEYSPFRRYARRFLFRTDPDSPHDDHIVRIIFVSSIFSHGASNEMRIRREKKENEDGKKIREFIVEKEHRAELLVKLAENARASLTYPQATGAAFKNLAEEKMEAHSIATTKILDSVAEWTQLTIPAESRKYWEVSLSGELNRVLPAAHEHLRTRIDTLARRDSRMVVSVERLGGLSSNVAETFDQISDARNEATSFRSDSRILIEQAISQGGLTREEKDVLNDHYFLDLDENEIAAKRNVVQSTIAKRLKRAQAKMKVVISPPS